MPLEDWNLEAAEEAEYARAIKEEEEKKYAEQVGKDLARYMGV